MKINEDKLDPELLRWVREDKAGDRTVVIRFAFSQTPDEAAEVLGKAGMEMQSCGPGVVVATACLQPILAIHRVITRQTATSLSKAQACQRPLWQA